MAKPPLILITPGIEQRGFEFSDLSVSLAVRYENAILAAGGIPVIAPVTRDRALLAEAVRRTDGVLFTGGDDLNPELYDKQLAPKILKTITQTPDEGGRDTREILLVKEVFRQRKPVLAICRGHQILNVAFDGQLIADIPQQISQALPHQQSQRAFELVHEAALTPGSLLAKLCGQQTLGVNSTHHQGIIEPAKPFVATAVASDGLVEAMELKPAWAAKMPFLLSVQFHPERLVEIHVRYQKIFGAFVAACGKNLKKKS